MITPHVSESRYYELEAEAEQLRITVAELRQQLAEVRALLKTQAELNAASNHHVEA